MAYAYGINCMNNALKIMCLVFEVSKDSEGLMQGILSSSVYFGCLLGSITGIKILRFGVRKCLMVIDVCVILGCSLLWIKNIYVFLIGRVIMGIGCGLSPAISSYYLQQYCPKELSGITGGLNPLA